MAPMNWTILFIIFVCLFILTLSLIYFCSNLIMHSSSKNNQTLQKNYLMWKW